jgi:hypothetical protein
MATLTALEALWLQRKKKPKTPLDFLLGVQNGGPDAAAAHRLIPHEVEGSYANRLHIDEWSSFPFWRD